MICILQSKGLVAMSDGGEVLWTLFISTGSMLTSFFILFFFTCVDGEDMKNLCGIYNCSPTHLLLFLMPGLRNSQVNPCVCMLTL